MPRTFTAHQCARDGARVALHDALIARGWTVDGFKEDRTDIQTDYFDYADWRGFARKGRAILTTDSNVYGCIQPDDPLPAAARDYLKRDTKTTAGRRRSWWMFDATTGELIDQGTGLYAQGSSEGAPSRHGFHRWPNAEKIADRATAAAEGKRGSNGNGKPEPVTVTTIRPGKRPGFIEIAFPAKPGEVTRARLKAAGFRWSRFSACWYGLEERLPSGFEKADDERPQGHAPDLDKHLEEIGADFCPSDRT